MVTLDPGAGPVMLINTFTVESAKAEELLAALSAATAHGMAQRPGFVSANLHISLTRTAGRSSPSGHGVRKRTPMSRFG